MSRDPAMARLNSLRVNLKHHGTVPSVTDVGQARADVTTFLRDSTALIFDRDFDRLTMSDLVSQPSVRSLVEEAEQAAQADDWINAVAALEKAFRELMSDYSKRSGQTGTRGRSSSGSTSV